MPKLRKPTADAVAQKLQIVGWVCVILACIVIVPHRCSELAAAARKGVTE